MDFENMNIWCWLLPALIGVISGVLGYLIGKSGSTPDHSADLKLLQDKNAKLQADLDACNGKLATQEEAIPKAVNISFDANAARSAMGKTIKENDLKVVEGIGPKIEGMFQTAGIGTWKALSETAVAKCQEILDGGGERYKVHDPSSWPMQAKMCYEGKWAELARWQDEHDYGKL